MEFVDERIAMLEREYRRQKKEEAEAEEEKLRREEGGESIRPEMTLKEMLEAVREGSVTLPDGKTHTFETRVYFDDKIPMVLIRNFYTGVKEENEVIAFVNNESNVCQMMMASATDMEKIEIDEWKKLYKEEMKKMGIYIEIIKAEALENIDYLVYRAPTSKGWAYNLIFRINYGSGRLVGIYNCFEKDKSTYGLMLEAMVLRLNELLIKTREGESDEECSHL